MTHKMRLWLVVLGAVGLLTALAQSRFITQPGYMDACYSYNGGYSLASGRGWSDPYVWNYLDDPSGLPHPSHVYWMPLPSLVAAAGNRLAGLTFRGAQVPFIILAALLPAVTGWVAWRLLANARQAALAGMLAAFTGFYAAYSTTTDGFILYALIGTGVFMIAGEALARPRGWLWLALGALLGLAHLTRADGLLLLAVVLGYLWIGWPRRSASRANSHLHGGSASRALGLALIVLDWCRTCKR
ncbi:MAG: glycosyltransferase family 39 protein [Chloroflexi bacterium]|nr:glycosyltransferase family 39 protein [Chloroflexota bacterium]